MVNDHTYIYIIILAPERFLNLTQITLHHLETFETLSTYLYLPQIDSVLNFNYINKHVKNK